MIKTMFQELSIGPNTSRIQRMSRYMFHMITCALFIAICMDGAISRKSEFFSIKKFFSVNSSEKCRQQH